MVHTTQPVLQVDRLSIAYRTDGIEKRVVSDVSFTINRGEVVALVGESGSGKTTTAQAIIGLLVENGRREAGNITLNGVDITSWSQKRLDSIRGSVVSLIPQDPGSSLNPVKTIGEQLEEILLLHSTLTKAQRHARAVQLLERVGLSYPRQRARQYPHQLSGGMKQRVLIAIAIAMRPALIIADEPTSALDVTVQRHILDLIDELRREFGTAVLFVTHDLAVATSRADRIMVFRHGRICEQGNVRAIVCAPQDNYTRQLFNDATAPAQLTLLSPDAAKLNDPIVEMQHVSKSFSLGGGESFQALDNVSLRIFRGTTHAVVGESGSGKSTLARILLGFQQADSGQIFINGREVSALRGEALRQHRRTIQLVSQNPYASLDPSQRIGKIIEEPLLNYQPLSRQARRERVEEAASRVALPLTLLDRKPRMLSGGQRQRVAIARALILRPEVLVLDEATSALDVTVQAQILRLLAELQQTLGLSYLFITHDLSVVRQLAHYVSVLRAGRQIESGSSADVFSQPSSDYTRELIAAVPALSPAKEIA